MYAKMSWEKLLSKGRLKEENHDNHSNNFGRNEFQKDVDRIIFSSSFRRLGRKTQVHLINDNYFFPSTTIIIPEIQSS